LTLSSHPARFPFVPRSDTLSPLPAYPILSSGTSYPQRTGAMLPSSSPIHRCPLECLSAGAVVFSLCLARCSAYQQRASSSVGLVVRTTLGTTLGPDGVFTTTCACHRPPLCQIHEMRFLASSPPLASLALLTNNTPAKRPSPPAYPVRSGPGPSPLFTELRLYGVLGSSLAKLR
jgi:hypothetical protein